MNDIELVAIRKIATELKKIKEVRGISGEMTLSDEIDKVVDLCELLKNSWTTQIEALSTLQQKYTLNSIELSKDNENCCWQQVSKLIVNLANLNQYADYVATLGMILELVSLIVQRDEN